MGPFWDHMINQILLLSFQKHYFINRSDTTLTYNTTIQSCFTGLVHERVCVCYRNVPDAIPRKFPMKPQDMGWLCEYVSKAASSHLWYRWVKKKWRWAYFIIESPLRVFIGLYWVYLLNLTSLSDFGLLLMTSYCIAKHFSKHCLMWSFVFA